MKKLLCACLSIALIFTLFCPLVAMAYQEETPPPPPPPAPASPATEGDEETFWALAGFDTVELLMQWVMDWLWYDTSNYEPFWEVWGEYSRESFMEAYELDEAGYQVLEDAWRKTWEEARDKKLQEKMDELVELGGTPGIINVMYNGGFIKFSGAVPEKTGGSTFVPMKAFFEALGASVGYDAQTRVVSAEFEGWSVGFSAGKDTLSISEDGATREFPLGVQPYIKNGVSYVPVRSVAEAMGISVYWDATYDCVVLIDAAKVIAEIDKSFTIANSLLEMPAGQFAGGDGTYKTVLDMLVSVTQLDSLDGDTTTNIKANFNILADGRNFSVAGVIDLSDLIDMLLDDPMFLLFYEDELEDIIKQQNAIRQVKAELIFNYDEGMLYVRVPALSLFIPDLPDGAWIAIGGLGGNMDFPDLGGIMAGIGFGGFGGAEGQLSVGSIIYYDNIPDYYYSLYPYYYYSYWRYSAINYYSDIMDSAGFYKALFGDALFVKKGGDYTIELTLEELLAAGEEFGHYLDTNEFSLKATIKTKDDGITGVSGKLVYRDGYNHSYNVTRYKCDFDLSPEKVDLNLEIHERNSQIVRIGVKSATAGTTSPIPAAPPSGDTVISIEDLLGMDEGYLPDNIQPLALTA